MTKIWQDDEIIELKKKMREKMDTLPQRDVIEASDATQWIDYVANVMPNEAMWHMIRAGGIGGSEIGVLVRNYLGQRADHEQSAHDWAMGKLLRQTPSPSTGVTRRGHDTEPMHAQMFYADIGAVRDEVAFEKLTRAQGQRAWMRYSPDELVRMLQPTTILQGDAPVELRGRILVDYKAPTEVDEHDKIAFQYMCQLHMGAMLCEEQGIELTGAMLSQLNWATWTLKKDFITIDPEICDLIRQAGDYYWSEMLAGRVPRYVQREKMILPETMDPSYMDLAAKLATIKAMAARLDKAKEVYQAELFEKLNVEGLRFDGQAIVFPNILTITAPVKLDETAIFEALGEDGFDAVQTKETQTKYDTDALVRRLKALNEDVKPYRKMTKVDPGKAFIALSEKGLDPEAFLIESPRTATAKNIKAQADQWFEENFMNPQPDAPIENETEHGPDREAA